MKRFLTIIAATAAGAAVAAAITIPAGADPSADPEAPLATCLRAQGLDVPTTNDALKRWVAQHADDPGAKSAFEACHFSARPAGPNDAKSFADCLRRNGADVPANLDGIELKTWVRDHASPEALGACAGGVAKEAGPDCGAGKPAAPKTTTAPAAKETATARATVRIVRSRSNATAAQ